MHLAGTSPAIEVAATAICEIGCSLCTLTVHIRRRRSMVGLRIVENTFMKAETHRLLRFANTSGLVPFPFQPHLAPEHAVDKEEVAKRENHTKKPPNQSNAQSVMTSSRVVDG